MGDDMNDDLKDKVINTMANVLIETHLPQAIGKGVEFLSECIGAFGGDWASETVKYSRESGQIKRLQKRQANATSISEKTNSNLANKNIALEDCKGTSLKFQEAFIEKATVEDDETLQQKYANLLANALDPNFEFDITKNYITILSELNPVDIKILDRIYNDYLRWIVTI